MGKPFKKELESIARTFKWARKADVLSWRKALDINALSLVTVGSGGSLSLAKYAAQLNEERGGGVSRAETPLGIMQGHANLKNAAVILISAKGRNPDILSAYRALVRREPKRILVVCSSIGSPLSKIAQSHDEGSVLEFECPAGNDGFLATNSLLATATLLIRSFLDDDSEKAELPCSLDELFPDAEATVRRALSKPGFVDRETLVVLHGKHTEAAATDVESKFTEAALARVQLSDFRNFAHGRHHWLAKRSSESAVLSLETKDDVLVSGRTVELLPNAIPVVRLKVPHAGSVAGLAGFVAVLHATSRYGEARSIDPGRPGVPIFGRRLYNLRVYERMKPSASDKGVGVSRKLISVGAGAPSKSTLRSFFESEYEHVIARLHGIRFGALILDYDGTLCHYTRRFTLPEKSLTRRLVRLANQGLILGFATGRGRSVRRALQEVMPARLWSKVAVGYYNCSDIGLLSEESAPDTAAAPSDDLRAIAKALAEDKIISKVCELTERPSQITVAARGGGMSETTVWSLVSEVVARTKVRGIQVLSSSHSVDVLECSRSKLDLLLYVRQKLALEGNVLCIGDRGAWPGNDFELLNHRFSLSVDEVAASPDAAWNLAPAGVRGTVALGWYLDKLKMRDSSAVFRFPCSPKRSRS